MWNLKLQSSRKKRRNRRVSKEFPTIFWVDQTKKRIFRNKAVVFNNDNLHRILFASNGERVPLRKMRLVVSGVKYTRTSGNLYGSQIILQMSISRGDFLTFWRLAYRRDCVVIVLASNPSHFAKHCPTQGCHLSMGSLKRDTAWILIFVSRTTWR